jgi:hypothetical protein
MNFLLINLNLCSEVHFPFNETGSSPVTLPLQLNPDLLFVPFHCSKHFKTINQWCRLHWTSSSEIFTGEDPCCLFIYWKMLNTLTRSRIEIVACLICVKWFEHAYVFTWSFSLCFFIRPSSMVVPILIRSDTY